MAVGHTCLELTIQVQEWKYRFGNHLPVNGSQRNES